jgi:hypothetical protein
MGSTIIFHWFAQAISVMRAVQSLLDPHGQDHLLHARVAAVAHVPWVKKRGCSLSIILLRELHKLHNTKVVTNKSTIPLSSPWRVYCWPAILHRSSSTVISFSLLPPSITFTAALSVSPCCTLRNSGCSCTNLRLMCSS